MGLFDNIFKRKSYKNPSQINNISTSLKLINDYDLYFSSFAGDLYEDSTARACVDIIAKHCAKLGIKQLGSSINFDKKISTSPNAIQSSYDFIYKIITNLMVRNNVFIQIKRVGAKVVELIPLDYSSCSISKDGQFVYFVFSDGTKATAEYKELIHIRRHYLTSSFGKDSISPIVNNIEAMHIANEGIINATKNSAKLRGLLKYTNSLRREDKASAKSEFEQDYLNVSNDGGIAILDSKADFIPLAAADFKLVNADQWAEFRKALYIYFGVSEAILTGNYTEDQFNAFYSSVIEPIAIQMSLEFTRKIFTDKEISTGNKIIFSAERLTFANNQTKANLINLLLPLGVLSVNEARVILELDELEEDKRLMSLNYVDFDQANAYQLGKVGAAPNDPATNNEGGGNNGENNQISNE